MLHSHCFKFSVEFKILGTVSLDSLHFIFSELKNLKRTQSNCQNSSKGARNNLKVINVYNPILIITNRYGCARL